MRAMQLKKLENGVVSLVAAFTFAASHAPTFAYASQPAASAQTGGTPVFGVGPPRFQVEHESSVLSVAWSFDGKLVASGTREGRIHITDKATGKEVKNFVVGDTTIAIAFSPSGKTLAISVDGYKAGLWSIESGQEQPSNIDIA